MEADVQGWVGSLNFQMDLFMLRHVKRNLVSIPFPISHHTINVEMKYFAYWLKVIKCVSVFECAVFNLWDSEVFNISFLSKNQLFASIIIPGTT